MKTLEKYIPILTVVGIILLWYVGALIVDMEFILPTPFSTLKAMGQIYIKKEFYVALLGTFSRALISFAFSLLLAVLFGVVASLSKILERAFYPFVLIVRATPTMSVIFLCLIWFNSKISPMFVAVMVIFPTLYTAVLSSIKSCDEDLVEMSKVYKVPQKVRLKKFYLPWVFDRVFEDATGALSLNVKLVVAAEALAQTRESLGDFMQSSKANLETEALFAYTVAAILLSFSLELFMKGIRKIVKRRKYAKSN